jgi:ubiquinone/menaquinone biosynthesis C-methylase UbiE
MKRTNYADVASRYDENQIRHRIPTDEFLRLRLASSGKRPLVALDLACGTGNYLAIQSRAFGADVIFRGIDASEAMLARARTKVEGVELTLGRAEELPYESGSLDYVVTSFAFHHFENKPRALDEVARVTSASGAFRMFNIDPGRMRGWWIYRFFPAALLEDEKRFWSTELIAYELERRGYEARAHIDVDLTRQRLADIWEDAARRDISQLAILDDAEYQEGLSRLRWEMERDGAAVVADEIALITLTAVRR